MFKAITLILCILASLLLNCGFSATYVVDNNGDADNMLAYSAGDGTNSLRKCIRLANANAGADIINFNISGSTKIDNLGGAGGTWLSITDPVTIDGYTQTGASAGTVVIELDANNVGNPWFAISLDAGSSGSTIRGLNIYGANMAFRIVSTSTGNTISGNWVGTDITGNATAGQPITEHGIRIESSNNNVIGGSAGLIDRNIFASCGWQGIRIEGTSSGNTINGNYVGVGKDGTTDLGNGQPGIRVANCTNLTIGGGAANEGNVISGNGQQGILMVNCDNFTVKGNIVGLGADTTTVVDNDWPGIEAISGSDVGQIGGSGANEPNYVGGNTDNGIKLDASDNITIQGNYIGVAGDGSTSKPNTVNGIIAINCQNTTVGGTNAGEGNVVSSNGAHGITMWGASSSDATIQGNMVGVSADGLTALGNTNYGIELNDVEDSQIGGTTANARNVVSNNPWDGIKLISSPRTVIEGNYVGVDGSGNVDMGNTQDGIDIENSADVVIGGTTRAARNVISGNGGNGLVMTGSSSGGIIKANFIGVGADGSTLIKNDEHGIWSGFTAHNMTIGGPTVPERNVISGNGQFVVDADPDNGITGDGIRILGTDNHVIQNNYIGTDSTGTIGLGNHWGGISINDDSDNNDILDNLISDNRNEGLWIYNGSDNNEVYRNIIGEGSDGSALGNWDYGIFVQIGTSNSNIIGGSAANANTIAHTRGERPGLNGDGITVGGTAGNFNTITFNNIHCNAGLGIRRDGTSNENQAIPVILSSGTNSINGTGDNGRTIHIYRNTSADGGVACDCEGETYVGTTTVAGGVWSITHNLGLTTDEAASVSATQTTTGGSTSQFAACSSPLPVTYLDFYATTSGNTVTLDWTTIEEENNSHFIVQQSKDGLHFVNIAVVQGAGNSISLINYQLTNLNPNAGVNYYRLMQVDFNGDMNPSKIVSVNFEEQALSLKSHDGQYYLESGSDQENIIVQLVGMDGKIVMQEHHSFMSAGNYEQISMQHLSAGVYIVNAYTQSAAVSQRIVVD